MITNTNAGQLSSRNNEQENGDTGQGAATLFVKYYRKTTQKCTV